MQNYSDLFKYYKDCLFEDSSDAIFAEVIQGNGLYIRIDGEELSDRKPIKFTEVEKLKIQNFITTILEKKLPSASFWYGYPLLLIKGGQPRGFQNDCIKPIFYIPIRYNDDKMPEFDLTASPRINCAAFEKLGFEKELIKRFAEIIGLYNEKGIDINFTNLGEKLKNEFPDLNYDTTGDNRVFFNGTIFYSEQSNSGFTNGLERELSGLIKKDITNLDESCLSCFSGTPFINKIFNNNKLLEVFDLNENQTKSVLSAFNNKLTVVTGPPGTGKSQVVSSIIINAILLKQKVLFASKNHKAIKVVEAKLKKLHDKPFFVRLGKKDDEKKDLKAELLEYLHWLYYDAPPFKFKRDLIEKENILSNYISERNDLKIKIEDLRERRNNILKILRQTGKYFSDNNDNFKITINKIQEKNGVCKKLLLNKKIKIAANYIKAINNIHKIKSFEELLDEIDTIDKRIKETSIEYTKLLIDCQPLSLNHEQKVFLNEYISVLNNLTVPNLTPVIFKHLIEEKEALQRKVSNFLHTWCVTNLSIYGELPLDEGFFDLVVIDEASQCDIASVIPLLFRAKRVVVLGDPFQLKHITTIDEAISLEFLKLYKLESRYNYVTHSFYDLSEVLIKKEDIIFLNEHFRSHSDIISFSKKYWYKDRLTISTDYRNLHPIINSNDHAVQWIDVTGIIKQNNSSGAYIQNEIDKVIEQAIEIIRDKQFKGEIGIVTPFRTQAKFIREKLHSKLNENERIRILVETAVKFQGDEKDIIIFSPVVSDKMPKGVKYYYQETGNLLNVAITRARSRLIIIGDLNACLNSDIQHISSFARYVKDLNDGIISNIESKSESIYEEILYTALRESGIDPIQQYAEDQYRLDLAIINDKFKLNIEVDGKQFHTDWTGERLKADILRNQRLQNLGWRVLRFWSYEIRDTLDYCINRIKAEIDVGSKEHGAH